VKLAMDLVPRPLWGCNLRSPDALGRKRWRTLAAHIMEERGPACVVCGSTNDPRAHEVWTYRERATTGTATLAGIEITCALCHYAHHFAQTERLHQEGVVSDEGLKAIKGHFQEVNECSRRDFETHYDEALTVWRRRSTKRWRIDYGRYAEAVQEAIAYRAKLRERKRETA